MPRPKWCVNQKNIADVVEYLGRNQINLYQRIKHITDPTELQVILEDELDIKSIAVMRSSIRMNKSRHNKEVRHRKDINITITQEAHALIVALCEKDQMTLSDGLIRNLECLVEMPDEERNRLINKWS